MPTADAGYDIEADFAILEVLGGHFENIIDMHVSPNEIRKTLRRWLSGYAHLPEDEMAAGCLTLLAADLEIFTPSTSGRTMVDRYIKNQTPDTEQGRLAFQALSAAQFRLVRVINREGPSLVCLTDLATGEKLHLLDERISSLAAGEVTAMRLCPLASGRYVLISPLFVMDGAMLDEAMTFVRHGRPLGTGHRCAASLYRNIARRGFQPMPQRIVEIGDIMGGFLRDAEEGLSPVQQMALRWIAVEDIDPDLVSEARSLTSVDNLVDALGHFAAARNGDDVPDGLLAAFEQIAALQVDTIVGRIQAGIHGAAEMLSQAESEVANYVMQGNMDADARDLFERLKQRSAFSGAQNQARNTASETTDIDRVIQRIQALRAKTLDQGCTEAEALAAAAKVSELLARHDLTLDEVSVRQADCEGISVVTERKRRAPADSCMQPIAKFCDCRVWREHRADDVIGYLFFGLKADVAAARFLYGLIEATFETESANFRRGTIYQSLHGSDRRTALHSFQTGLANGISGKLTSLKAAREAGSGQSTGFDLVAVKHAVLDDEISRLGLRFTTRSTTSRRYIQRDAYHAGKVAGDSFEPSATLKR